MSLHTSSLILHAMPLLLMVYCLAALGGLGGPAGLQLRVDSYMSQGSWDSGGWAPGLRELSLHLRAPSDLQIISPDDLVKVNIQIVNEFFNLCDG